VATKRIYVESINGDNRWFGSLMGRLAGMAEFVTDPIGFKPRGFDFFVFRITDFRRYFPTMESWDRLFTAIKALKRAKGEVVVIFNVAGADSVWNAYATQTAIEFATSYPHSCVFTTAEEMTDFLIRRLGEPDEAESARDPQV
jgi:hypothetical protein